tara:strand:- start:677 stop:2815 length:2139 start_codon:yes stop_codon:yes gene_type:complete
MNAISEALQDSSNHNTELMDFYMEMITTREFPGRCHSRPLLDLISQPKTASYNLRNALTNLHFVSGQRLKNHQKNAIDFMLKYETEGFEERFWINFDACTNTSYCSEGNYEISTNRQTLQYCPTMNCLRKKQAFITNAYGGFLCDDTGLGKTLTLLSLSCITSEKGPTLVVVPLSVLDHWKTEARKLHNSNLADCQYESNSEHMHETPERFHFYAYYGQSRIRNHHRLESENNVIITTYTTLQRDFSNLRLVEGEISELDKRKCPLLFVNFNRLILDESHKISYSYKNVLSHIKTQTRWCVTATPLGDGSHFPSCKDQFDILLNNNTSNILHEPVLPIDNRSWRTQVTNLDMSLHTSMTSVMTNSDNHEVRFVPAILLSLLRFTMVRNNEQHANSLQDETLIPDIIYQDLFCEFSESKKHVYSEQLSQIKNRIQMNRNNGALSTRVFNSFRRWISLGGHCNVTSVSNPTMRPQILSEEERAIIQIPEDVCNICLEEFEEPCVLPCNHFLCYGCALNMANMSVRTKCPMCRGEFDFTQVRLYEETSHLQDNDESDQVPEKIRRISDYLFANHETRRVVVFSEFKSTQSSLVTYLRELRPEYEIFQLNGSMSSSRRSKEMSQFSASNKAVIILSVRACAAGINLQSADTLFFMEPMLMKTQEKQAVGRIKRIGQLSSSIKVIYLIYKNSIEENLRNQSSDWRPNVLNMISLLNS